MTRAEELELIEAAVRSGRFTKITNDMVQERGLLLSGTPEFKMAQRRFTGNRRSPVRLSDVQKAEVRRRRAQGATFVELAKMYRTSKASLSRLCEGINKKEGNIVKALILAASLLTAATPALAWNGSHGGGWHGGHGSGNWVAPFVGGAIVGGVLGGALAYPYAPYYAAPQPYYAPQTYQPYYHWDCNVYSQCAWVWR